MTGRYFTAEEALAANLINRVAPKDTVMEAAPTLAVAVAANHAIVCACDSQGAPLVPGSLREGGRIPAGCRCDLYLTEAFPEAALAFKEKRKPRGFKGR